MVYKKYAEKRGRLHGPYYYESYRDGNHVRKRYIGGKKEYKEWLKRKRKEEKGETHPPTQHKKIINRRKNIFKKLIDKVSGVKRGVGDWSSKFHIHRNSLRNSVEQPRTRIGIFLFLILVFLLGYYVFFDEGDFDVPIREETIGEFQSFVAAPISKFTGLADGIYEEDVEEQFDKDVDLEINNVNHKNKKGSGENKKEKGLGSPNNKALSGVDNNKNINYINLSVYDSDVEDENAAVVLTVRHTLDERDLSETLGANPGRGVSSTFENSENTDNLMQDKLSISDNDINNKGGSWLDKYGDNEGYLVVWSGNSNNGTAVGGFDSDSGVSSDAVYGNVRMFEGKIKNNIYHKTLKGGVKR